MTDGAASSSAPSMHPLPPDDDPIFGFLTKEWIQPAEYHKIPPETSEERYTRTLSETKYRMNRNDNPSAWYRYYTLGRYVVEGFHFDTIWNGYEDDPLRFHLVIWYQYMYHVDRKMDISPKLDAWATTRANAYLAIHAKDILSIDTLKVSWASVVHQYPAATPWNTVDHKSSKKKQKAQKSDTTTLMFKKASLLLDGTPPIAEENEGDINSSTAKSGSSKSHPVNSIPTPAGRPPNDNRSQASSDAGKISALIPNSKVPINDGTVRITIRWKTTIEVARLSQTSTHMTASIYSLLNDMFDDDDGFLYKWNDEGLETFNSISKMTPTEVRSFICPSLTLIPSKSMIIIPIRFGFHGKSPVTWRNQNSTKLKMQRLNTNVLTSNSKSTSGNLTIAGYILLKAPRTTHRVRYLQHLRSKLPDTTPTFDIRFHQRTPLEQDINHLAVECGENHVHPLSQALLNILDGSGVGIYIPRFAFSEMSTEQALKMFQTHDTFIKALSYISLSPLITNLDTLRTEYFSDGSKKERSVREWAATIMKKDGSTTARCDVVNGGYDQKAYLLMPPENEEVVQRAFEDYRRRVFPFRQREERFRENIGPPPALIQLNPKVIANLQFMEQLSVASEVLQSGSEAEDTLTEVASQENSTLSGESEVSSNKSILDPLPKPPPTSLESLRHHYGKLTTATEEDLTNTTASSGLSTNMARYRELGAQITRIKKENDKEHKNSSARLAVIERQLHRFDDFEETISGVKEDMAGIRQEVREQFQHFEDRMFESLQNHVNSGLSVGSVSSRIDRLTELVEGVLLPAQNNATPSPRRKKQYPSPTERIDVDMYKTDGKEEEEPKLLLTAETATDDNAHLQLTDSENDDRMELETNDHQDSSSSESLETPGPPTPPNNEATEDTTTSTTLTDVKTALESRYTTHNSPGRCEKS
jgi:hypothetical protein